MSSYVVLARKWRPARFSDIVGQTHVVRTLTNAIRLDRIHQAYLLTGSRGIGKTSIARIFAKIVRCESRISTADESSDGFEWIRSCDECSNCNEIRSSNNVDVLEIDGASNNGVDAIREIRENAKYLPSSGKYKIYIIDEVHMLTTAAFNALLKTLEEPPAHVIFIFATTEPHKIPATILSRVQRFDLKRVAAPQIQNRIQQVLEAEKITAEPAAQALIARAAQGSMRDALSLLDQVIAYSGNNISVDSVRESTGLIESKTIIDILKHLAKREPQPCLEVLQQAYNQGHDLRVLTQNLIEFLHGVILAKVTTSFSASLELSEEEWNEIKEISQHRSLEEFELIFQVLNQGMEWIVKSNQPKIVLDILLIKCACADALFTIEGNGDEIDPIISQSSAPSVSSTPQAAPQTAQASAPRVSQQAATATASSTSPSPVPESQPKPTPTQKSWSGFIEQIRSARPLLASLLEHAVEAQLPLASGEEDLVLTFNKKDSYKQEQLESRAYRNQLHDLCAKYFEKKVSVRTLSKETEKESLAEKRIREVKEQTEQARNTVKTHPIIQEAQSLFGGEVGPIELINESAGQRA